MLGQAQMRFSSSIEKTLFIFSEIQSGTFYCLEQQNRSSHAKIQPKRVYLEFFIIFLKVGLRQESAYSSFIFLTVVRLLSGTSLCSGVFNGYHRIVKSFFYTVVYFYSFKV